MDTLWQYGRTIDVPEEVGLVMRQQSTAMESRRGFLRIDLMPGKRLTFQITPVIIEHPSPRT